MLRLYSSPKGFPFSALPAVYRDSLRASGAFQYPEEPAAQQEALAESDFLSYIRLDFFPRQGSLYALWELGENRSAPPGSNPTGTECFSPAWKPPRTSGGGAAPPAYWSICWRSSAGRAFPGFILMSARTIPLSLAVHKKCGFAVYKTTAVYLDGSADSRSYTLLLDFEKKLDFSRNM